MARLPTHYVMVATAAGSAAIVQAIIAATVTCVLIIQYSSCSDYEAVVTPDQYFLRVLKTHYFQDPECPGQINEDLVAADQLRVWLIVILALSAVWLATSIALIVVTDETLTGYFRTAAFTWCAVTVAVFIVDLALAVMFGLDYAKLREKMINTETPIETMHALDLLRIGSIVLICITLKGFVLHIINIISGIALVIFGVKANDILNTSLHSIHTQGTLNAYDSHKRISNPWHTQPKYDQTFERSGQLNRGFTDVDTWRNQPQTDFPSRSFDRSDSWHHTRVPPESSRPFTYLEEPRSPRIPITPPRSPIAPPWRRDPWDQPPPVPAPDYSPIGGRRLKSALKSSVM